MELIFKLWRLQLLVRIGAVYDPNWNRHLGSALAMAWGTRKLFYFGGKQLPAVGEM